jgi:hypothetical protein
MFVKEIVTAAGSLESESKLDTSVSDRVPKNGYQFPEFHDTLLTSHRPPGPAVRVEDRKFLPFHEIERRSLPWKNNDTEQG